MSDQGNGGSARGRVTIAVVGAAWVLFTIVLGILYAHVPDSPDQQTFDYVGWIALRGGRLYVDVTEQNFPGQMWLQELSTALFGNHMWSFRLFDYLWLLATAPILVAALAPEVGLRRALLIVPFYQVVYVTAGTWMAGQRDMVAAPLLLGAGLAYERAASSGKRGWLVLFALGTVCATLIRPTYVLFAPLLVLADALTASSARRSLKSVVSDGAVAAALCVGLIAVVVGWARANGTLAAWYESAVRYNASIYSHSQTYGQITRRFFTLVKSWHWYVVFGVAGAWAWWTHGKSRRVWATLITLAATSVASGYAQGKGFGYHLTALLPVLSVFDVYFIWWCVHRARARGTAATKALAVVVCAVAVLGLGKKAVAALRPQIDWADGRRSWHDMLAESEGHYADIVDAADYIKRTVPPDGEVLVWNRAVHVNFLSERRSPVRFITVGMMISARPPFEGAGPWKHEVEEAFATHPPAVIVMPERTHSDDEALWLNPNPSGASQVFWRQLATRYKHEISFGALDLYRLQPDAGSPVVAPR